VRAKQFVKSVVQHVFKVAIVRVRNFDTQSAFTSLKSLGQRACFFRTQLQLTARQVLLHRAQNVQRGLQHVPEVAIIRLRDFVFQVSIVSRKSVCQKVQFVICQRNLQSATPFRNRQEGITIRRMPPKFLFVVECEYYRADYRDASWRARRKKGAS
jgi:hypothetical protein